MCGSGSSCQMSWDEKKCGAFTVVELVIVAAIIAVLAAVATPLLKGYLERTSVRQAVQDIQILQFQIEREVQEFGKLPTQIDHLMQGLVDPWGNVYEYLRLEGGDPSAKGKARKDKSLVPINSDYDLYSMGADGESKAPLTAKASHDDIVRANDGGYLGLASAY